MHSNLYYKWRSRIPSLETCDASDKAVRRTAAALIQYTSAFSINPGYFGHEVGKNAPAFFLL
jgi:hypothetical protein